MGFTGKEVKEGTVQSYLLKYWNLVAITGFELKESSKGTVQLIFNFIGKNEEVGKAKHRIYFAKDDVNAKNKILEALDLIGEKIGISDKLKDTGKLTSNLELFVKLAKDKFFWACFKAEEYKSNEGKKGFTHSLKEVKIGKNAEGKDEYIVLVFAEADITATTKNEKGEIILVKGIKTTGKNKGNEAKGDIYLPSDFKLLSGEETNTSKSSDFDEFKNSNKEDEATF